MNRPVGVEAPSLPRSTLDTPSLAPMTGSPTLVVAAIEDRAGPDLVARTRPYRSDTLRHSVIDAAGHVFGDRRLENAVDKIDAFPRGLK